MDNLITFITIDEYKIKASILFKALKSADLTETTAAIERFRQLELFNDLSIDEIKTTAKHKHALEVIALEQGFESWRKLKKAVEQMLQLMFVDHYANGFLNKWFASYDEAKLEQKKSGGYLLPYKSQFFLCENDYIEWLGFDSDDADWQAIDFDWAKPKSQKAWQRLYQQWVKIQEKKND